MSKSSDFNSAEGGASLAKRPVGSKERQPKLATNIKKVNRTVANPGYCINHTSFYMQIPAGISKITFRLPSRRSSLAGVVTEGSREEKKTNQNLFQHVHF